jgi:hypothetical protein
VNLAKNIGTADRGIRIPAGLTIDVLFFTNG